MLVVASVRAAPFELRLLHNISGYSPFHFTNTSLCVLLSPFFLPLAGCFISPHILNLSRLAVLLLAFYSFPLSFSLTSLSLSITTGTLVLHAVTEGFHYSTVMLITQ